MERQIAAARAAGAVAAWRWTALPALKQERNMPAVVRDAGSGALLAFGGLPTTADPQALNTAEKLPRNLALDAVADESTNLSTMGCNSISNLNGLLKRIGKTVGKTVTCDLWC